MHRLDSDLSSSPVIRSLISPRPANDPSFLPLCPLVCLSILVDHVPGPLAAFLAVAPLPLVARAHLLPTERARGPTDILQGERLDELLNPVHLSVHEDQSYALRGS